MSATRILSIKDAQSATDGAVFMLLNRAAERGDVCPSNLDIIFCAGLSSSGCGSRILKRLQAKGLIEVYSGQCSRVVRICGTGKQTAGEMPRTHWRDRPENKHRKHKLYRSSAKPRELPPIEPCASFQALKPVDRDPCGYCGVRGDVPCKHRPEVRG